VGAPPFLAACRREPVPYTPVWLMRQAGRYMPEYRAVREKLGFLGLCKNPDVAAEVTVTAATRLGVDAAIIFSDILLVLEPLGVGLEYAAGDGPVIHRPVRSGADVDRLPAFDPAALGYVGEAVRRARAALPASMPLIGFAGAPFTLASYLVEGGGSRTYARTKGLMQRDPGAWHALMERLSAVVVSHVNAQIDAGAQAVQLFDSWAGILSPHDFQEYALRWAKHVIAKLRAHPAVAARRVPIIYFVNGCAPYLDSYATSGADVLGVDWRIDLATVRARVGDGVALQGNLDPGALFLDPDSLRARVEAILEQGGGVGHVFNLGHGVTPETDPERVRVMVETVKARRW
jgi:uroporphyrinogen decarboxylase